MGEQSPDYKKLFFEEQRRREEEQRRREEEQRRREEEQRLRGNAERAQEEAERAQKEAERAQEEAERAQEEAERAQEEAELARESAEQRTQKTTLPELLHHCHIHLSLGLYVQTDSSLSTRGNPSNADRKLRPNRIRRWDDFGAQQEAIWAYLINSTFAFERLYPSTQYLRELGDTTSRRLLSSEIDLNLFQRITVEDHVSAVIEELSKIDAFRHRYDLLGSVNFENHGNTLSVEEALKDGVRHLSVSGGPRRSPRLQALREAQATSSVPEEATKTRKSAYPRADQFCVYNIASEHQIPHRIPAFIIEYKAPHKLSLGCIYEGLQEIDLDDVVQIRDDEEETAQTKCRRLVAAVITQAFSYMIRAGLEYGLVCTGEAYIYLRVPDDPSTVYYFLSVPKSDVGMETGWTPKLDVNNRLHLTAVGQMLAFTLLTLQTRPRAQEWRDDASARLSTWQIVYQDLLDQIPTPERDTSEYRPNALSSYHQVSPIRVRRHRAPRCSPARGHMYNNHESDRDSDQETPSRPQQQRVRRSERDPRARRKPPERSAPEAPGQRQHRRYCTQDCLRGLVDGGLLDPACPNAGDHGQHRHRIDQRTFLRLMQEQLSRSLDHDIECLRIHGARGVLFRICLSSHGYTIVAKGTPAHFTKYLRHEARVYDRLRPIQGRHVPVHLGSLDLPRPYHYDGIVDLVHVMLLSYGGTSMARNRDCVTREKMPAEADHSLAAIHALGVLHRDAMPRNMLWNASTKQVLVIDFERAELQESRTVLGGLSPNRKRKRLATAKKRACIHKNRLYAQERKQALRELQAG